MGLLNFNSVGSVNNSSTVPQSSNPAKGSKAINIDFPVTDMINMSAGMRYETDNADGSKTVVQYDGKGETYTEKTFFENKMTSYKKYSAFGNKLLKDADYDFVTGKMYQESEYFDDGRIDKHYDEDGFYSGKNEITFEKDGSTRVNRYDKDNNYLGSSIQSKIQNRKSTITELDANGNITSRREDKLGMSIGEKMIRM